MNHRSTETHYETLRVHREATVTEIVAAYHSAKNAFSGDSVATYSLFNAKEIKEELARLEEAYATLSNIERKRDYDEWLARRGDSTENADAFAPPPRNPHRPTQLALATAAATKESRETTASQEPTPAPGATITILADTPITGALFKKLRESRGMTVQDVARITKIPAKFIQAIENDIPSALPARVYLQGFVKNLAVLYHIDASHAAQSYLSRFTTA